MLKNHTPFRTILLSACFLPGANLAADVLSSTITSDLVEPAGTYDNSSPSLINMHVKTVIGTGACVADTYDGCTLNDVLNDIDNSDDFKPEIKVHMTADNYPDDGLVTNAELRQRGATSRGAPQKSFRVKLDKDRELWSGERRIQLIKSFWDFSRIRNKLSYDMFIDIPNLPTMRSQFVKLTLEDQGTTEDYGLYTQVEYFGKEYLTRRGWDKDSGVYKAEGFYFRDNSALALDANGEPLDEDAFEQLLEIKRGDDHSKLVEMIQAINNPSLDFNSQVFNKYFNKDNYLSWFAVNLLVDNHDTNFHNFYLYNPKDTEKFYFVPWDYDLALGTQSDNDGPELTVSRASRSHANWWGQELHKQFLRQPGNLNLLKEAMEEIKAKYFTPAKIQAKADSYYDVVFPLITSSPDIDTLFIGGTNPEKVAAYNRIFSNLAGQVQQNYDRFIEHIGDPMPFWMGEPIDNNNGSYTFDWSKSESLTNQTIRYDIEISTSGNFESDTIVYKQNGIQDSEVTIPWTYASGDYFYRVIARDADAPTQYWQTNTDELKLSDGTKVFGVIAFNAQNDNVGARPVGNPDSASTTLNTAITIDVLANDIGSGLTLSSTDLWTEKGGNASIVNNKISYKPKSDYTGTDRLWYVFKDNQGRSNYGAVTISVSGDEYPEGNPDTASTRINTNITIDVLANDIGTSLTLVSTDFWTDKGGNATIVDNKINYQPKSNYTGTDRLWYVFKNAQGRSTFGAVTIEISGVERPDANPDFGTTSFNTSLTIDVLANDTGSELSLTTTNSWSLRGGRSSISNNRIIYTPKPGFTGQDEFWYDFKDVIGQTNSAKVTIEVTEQAAYPVAITDNISTATNTPITFDALANDTGAGLAITEVNNYSHEGGQVAIIDGQLRYTPKPNYSGTDSFWYVIKDSLDRTNATKVTVTVN